MIWTFTFTLTTIKTIFQFPTKKIINFPSYQNLETALRICVSLLLTLNAITILFLLSSAILFSVKIECYINNMI